MSSRISQGCCTWSAWAGYPSVWATCSLHSRLIVSFGTIKTTIEKGHVTTSRACEKEFPMSREEQKKKKGRKWYLGSWVLLQELQVTMAVWKWKRDTEVNPMSTRGNILHVPNLYYCSCLLSKHPLTDQRHSAHTHKTKILCFPQTDSVTTGDTPYIKEVCMGRRFNSL